MTHIAEDGTIVIEAEEPQQCDLCGKVAELRPYGPNEECVCLDCGMKDIRSVKRQFDKRFYGDKDHIHQTPGNLHGSFHPGDGICTICGRAIW